MRPRQLLSLAAVSVLILAAAPATSAHPHQEAASSEVAFKHPRPEIPGWTPADLYLIYAANRTLEPPRRFKVVRNLTETMMAARTDAIDISEALVAPGDGCWYPAPFSLESEAWGVRPAETVESLVASSEAVARGVVSGIEGGILLGGGPGLLLQVEVKTWLKKAQGQEQRDVVHVFYPRGSFKIGDALICATSIYDVPPPPANGAEILLFPRKLGKDPDLIPMVDLSSRIAFDSVAGARVTPELRLIAEFRSIDFRDLLRFTRDAIRTGGERDQ